MKLATLAVIAVILAGCSTPAPKSAPEQSMKSPEANPTPTPAPEAKTAMAAKKRAHPPASAVAKACKVTLAQAIETALAKVYGQALGAEVELENGKPQIDVKIFSNGKIWEVEIDGTTGVITEVEQEDDDDDDEDDDDGDDD